MKWLSVLLLFITITSSAKSIFVSQSGTDAGAGVEGAPYATFDYAVSKAQEYDIIYISGSVSGQTISLQDKNNLLVASSYGVAEVSSGTLKGFLAINCKGITIRNIAFFGSSTIADAYHDGIAFWYQDETAGGDIVIDNCMVTGYSGNGVSVYNYQVRDIANVTIVNTSVRSCKNNGIIVWNGWYSPLLHNIKNVLISKCTAQENPGGVVSYTHTGSGILVVCAVNVRIEYCEAAYNGSNNTASDGGPVGIWVADVDSAVIYKCSSHDNSSNLKDGGGYDADGGCSYVLFDQCESYNNKGAGFMVYEYNTPSGFKTNHVIFRNCTSTNDALNSLSYGAIAIGGTISDVSFEGNTIVQDQGYVVRSFGGSYKNVSVKGNNICYNIPAQFSNFGTAPAGVVIDSNTFPCIVLSIDTTRRQPPLPGFPSSYYMTPYPNPARSEINVVMNAPRGMYSLEVYSIFGQLMGKWPIRMTGRKSLKLDISKYGSGMYWMMLVDEYGRECKQKFLKLE